METILAFIIASGILGFLANWIVSIAKYLREQGIERLNINPRIIAASASIVLAFVQVVAGGDADIASLQSALEILVTAGGTFAVAHWTHRANSI